MTVYTKVSFTSHNDVLSILISDNNINIGAHDQCKLKIMT